MCLQSGGWAACVGAHALRQIRPLQWRATVADGRNKVFAAYMCHRCAYMHIRLLGFVKLLGVFGPPWYAMCYVVAQVVVHDILSL